MAKMGRREVVDRLLDALRRQSGVTVLMHAAVAARAGLAVTDHKCLDQLIGHGPMTAGELATRVRLTTGAITGVVDRLEKAGLVTRRADPADRRRVIVAPDLDRARAVFGPIFAEVAQDTVTLLDRYSAEELTLLLEFVERATRMAERIAERLTGPP